MGVEITSVSKDKSGNYYDNDIEAIRESDDQGRLLASGLRWKEGRDGFLGVLSFLLLVISIAAGAVGCLALAYIAFLSNVSWNTTYALAGCVVVFVIGPARRTKSVLGLEAARCNRAGRFRSYVRGACGPGGAKSPCGHCGQCGGGFSCLSAGQQMPGCFSSFVIQAEWNGDSHSKSSAYCSTRSVCR
jgi:hypothetical protein